MKRSLLFCAGLTLAGCHKQPDPFPVLMAPASPSYTLRSFLDDAYEEQLATDPVAQHYQGITHQQDKWTLRTDAYEKARLDKANDTLRLMRSHFDLDVLNSQAKLNYILFEKQVQRMNDAHEWRYHSYEITQMHGTHAWIPSFLINVHKIDDRVDATAYISRLNGVDKVIDLAIQRITQSHEKGVLPPAFVFPMVIEDCNNLIKGAPFEDGEPGPWLEDFQTKINGVDTLTDEEKASAIQMASDAIVNTVGPAYKHLIETLETLAKEASTDDGVWKLPNGGAYYDFRLRATTTTDQTADQIHATGLAEVARIHDEMRAIQSQVGYRGTLQDFFSHLRTDPKFYYANDDAGRQQYLDEALKLIRTVEAALPRYFHTTPRAPLAVKAVEPYREKSAGKAFYSRGTPDGSRPGTYYANLYDMDSMPTYQMEALAYHEGIPGHHMQNSIAQEIDGIAKFRQFSGYTAYGEGWGLYSEFLPKEMGFYTDPYSDFGRLAMELWRACRLVVDTGIHRKRWTRQEAIDYLMENTPNPRRDAVKAIERYIVMPGQATGYKVGMLEILALRARAKEALGDRFQLADFHEVVLTNGPVPLGVLRVLVDQWIERTLPKSED